MTPILDRIRANSGEVIREGWRIKLRRGRLTDDALAWVARNRDALHREVWPLVDDWQERSSIREFDGGQDRTTAEAAAYEEVTARC